MYAKCSACPVRCWVGGESHWGPLGISDPHPKCPAPAAATNTTWDQKGGSIYSPPLLSIRGIAAGCRLMGPFYILSIALSLTMVLQSGVPIPWCMPNTAFNLCHPPFPSLFPAKNAWLGVGGGGGFLPHGSLESCWLLLSLPPSKLWWWGGGQKKKVLH